VRISLSAAQSVDDITHVIAALDAHARATRAPLAA
jgi:hypothetical protein